MSRKQRVIDAAEKALIELEKVITQKINLKELDPENKIIALNCHVLRRHKFIQSISIFNYPIFKICCGAY